jgi:8-amino-7-oxononanoate synthase
MTAWDFTAELQALEDQQLTRVRRVVEQVDGPHVVIDGKPLLAFCSNDYLGLAQHPGLIETARQAAERWGVGSGASPLVSGYSTSHEALEQELARFVGLPRALYFYAGYSTNAGVVPALVGRGDAVFSDALNHACLIDGARLSRAEIHAYAHGDVLALERLLAASTARRKLVITDAVFSMDGAIAPLPEILALCERFDALLMIDDAHGFGVLGPQGRGTAAHFGITSPRLLYMATLGKAAGVHGAFVAGQAQLVEWVLQRARSYIFATAAPALEAETLRTALQVIARDDWRRGQLQSLIAQLREGLAGLPWPLLASATPVQPLIVGDNQAALDLMAALRERGLWVPAIRPPTVPQGTARLRISLSAAHAAADVQRLVDALRELAQTR